MADIKLENVTKRFPDGYEAVRDMSLEIKDGEFMILVGPSGCGKSTALRMIAGLEDITDGKLVIGGDVVNDRPPKDRDIAMVFQNYALYPHMSVRDNMGFALKLRGTPKQEIDRKVEEAARILDLTQHLDRKPANLSGGQRQRVAMGRAIVRDPKAFLMDEPLSNLDAKLRVQMRAEIARIQQTLKVTTLYVTHDQVEAMTMGDRVAVMRDGVLQQVDTSQRLYDAPVNLFVASFVGSPQMNLFEAELVRQGGSLVCRLGDTEIELPVDVTAARPGLAAFAGGSIAVGIRPEDVTLASTGESVAFPARVLLVEALGAEHLVHLEIAATPLRRPELVDAASQPSEAEGFGRSSTLLGRFDRTFLLQPGEAVEVSIDPHRLHFFELGSGTAIEAVDAPVLDRVTG